MPKGFKNLLKLDLENQFRKIKRDSYLFFPLSLYFGPLAVFLWPARIFPSPSFLPCWAGPSALANRRCHSLPVFPSAADRPGPLVGTSSDLPLDSDARGRGETAPAPRSLLPSWERHPTPGPFKWKPHPTPLPLLPFMLQSRLRASQPQHRKIAGVTVRSSTSSSSSSRPRLSSTTR
jgi:hypothetical protein